jgi:hypothetical protein
VIPLLKPCLSSLQYYFHPSSPSIIHSIILGDGTQKKEIHGSLKTLLYFPVPLSFSEACVFSVWDCLKLCQGAIYFFIEMWGCFHRWKLRG